MSAQFNKSNNTGFYCASIKVQLSAFIIKYRLPSGHFTIGLFQKEVRQASYCGVTMHQKGISDYIRLSLSGLEENFKEYTN